MALENTKVMTWTALEIMDLTLRRPRLAVALLQILVQRVIDFVQRIESFTVDITARRLARTLTATRGGSRGGYPTTPWPHR